MHTLQLRFERKQNENASNTIMLSFPVFMNSNDIAKWSVIDLKDFRHFLFSFPLLSGLQKPMLNFIWKLVSEKVLKAVQKKANVLMHSAPEQCKFIQILYKAAQYTCQFIFDHLILLRWNEIYIVTTTSGREILK